MKNTANALTVLAVAVGVSLSAEADNHTQNGVDPVDLYSCTFKEGKGMGDLDKLDARFKKWSDENDKAQSVWRMVPILRSNNEPFDVGYIGAWNTGAEMGAGMDAWGNGGQLLADYVATIDCGHALVASAEVSAPNGPPENGVVWFSSCTLAEGSSHEDAYAAHKASSAGMRELGGKAQSWLFYPSLGFGDIPFDYYSVVSFNSMSELGEGWEMYYNQCGWQKAQAVSKVASCDSPRVYSVKAVRMGPQN